MKKIVQQCGYNSARDVSGLFNSPADCNDCPVGETLPPTDDHRIRTNDTTPTLPLLKAHVLAAENGGGGWVPLVFHHICVCPGKGDEVITPTDFTAFVDWLSKRPATTSVHIVDEVMGGAFQPVVGQPLARLFPASAKVRPSDDPSITKALSKVPAWTVIAAGLIIALTVVFTCRVAARRNRPGR